MAEHAAILTDTDDASVFWLALADSAWRLGRPIARASAEALHIIESGLDLDRWKNTTDRGKRERVLTDLSLKLRSPPPPPKRVPKRFVANNQWEVGELIAYQLASGSWTAFRVIGHHVDKGGRQAVCEPLCWKGPAPPSEGEVDDVACVHR